MNLEQNIMQIPLTDLLPNRAQPRLTFDEKGLEELANSIKQHGIIQPLVVRRIGDKYEIIAGERRFKAATLAGLKTVPAVIAQIDDKKSAEVAIVENIQRRDLSAIEEARSYKKALDQGITQSELAKSLGISQSAIANKLRLLNLDVAVQEALINNEISERHARSLLVLTNPEDQKKWLEKIIRERMTVRELDEALKKAFTKTNPEEDTDIPLVKPLNIDEIRESATELPNVNEDSDIARKIAEIEREKMFNPDVIPVEQASNNSKNNFFNFLENETVNMNMEENTLKTPVIDINDSEEPPIDSKDSEFYPELPTPPAEEKTVESPLLEEDTSEPEITSAPKEISAPEPELPVSFPTPPEEPEKSVLETPPVDLSAPAIDLGPVSSVEEREEITPSSNIADEPASLSMEEPEKETPPEVVEPAVDIPTPPAPPTPEKPEPTPEVNVNFGAPLNIDSTATDFDPTSLIDTLDAKYEEKQEEALGLDLKSAINEIRNTKDLLSKKGFNLILEETDLEDMYQFVIKIKK